MTSSKRLWDNRELTTTPSTPSGGAPITLTSNYTNAAGQTLTFDQGAGFLLAAVVTVSNSGTISVSNNSAGFGAWGFEDTSENASPNTIDNLATGVIDVVADTGNAYGYSSGADAVDLNNSGQIEVTADNGDAYGLWDYGGYGPSEVDNSAGGVISVMASQTGIGLWGYQFGNSVTNAGTIRVTAGTAYGVVGANGLNNSGSIIATGTLTGGGSIAVDISAPATFYGGSGLFSNSGLIQATTAFFFDTSGYSPAYSGNITVKNTGNIIGVVNLAANGANSVVDNTGSIEGAVQFGSGSNIYSGAGGTQTGGIYAGSGGNTIALGNDGETVFANPLGGSDNITGGSGNDFIEIFRGNNVINGGGGFNTLSFAGADAAVTVNLSTGVATGTGTDNISNIQCVIAGAGADTLIAGAAAAELIAGSGQDTLTGGAGNDTLVAGSGGDTMTGGAGSNTFVFSAGDNTLTVTDFDQGGAKDSLHVYGYSAAQKVTQVGANTVITLSGADSIVLENTLVSTVTGGGSLVFEPGSFAVPQPSGTPPPPLGGSPITLIQNFEVYAGETLSFNAGDAFELAAAVTVSNAGTISVNNSSGGYGASGFDDISEDASPNTIDNSATGVIDVVADTGSAFGYNSGADAVDLNNSGQVDVTAENGDAYGVWDYGGYGASEVDNSASGVISVIAAQTGIGLWGYQFGNSVTNAGTIRVIADDAFGVVGANGLNNSGSIIATGTVAGGGSIAVDISAPATFYGGTGLFSNSGLIQATTAFFFDTSGYSPAYSGNITVKNTGNIIGLVDLSANSANSVVDNSGSIKGAVLFGSGSNNYDGSGGIQTGGIYAGSGSNTITLGNDGETLFGNPLGGTDTIKGGAGNDFIEIFRGNNNINGGGGFNTLSFAGADAALIVNLSTGVATGTGTDNISNIQCVIAGAGADTLIAGAAAAELIAGSGQDTLVGGAGNDTLVAGKGGDTMTGGAGSNTFVFSAGDKTLTVTDFDQGGSQDTLHVYGYSAAQSVTQVGANTVITLSSADSIILENTLVSTVTGGGSLVFEPGSFAVPQPSGTPPRPLGGSPITLTQNFEVFAGETLSFNAGAGFLLAAAVTVSNSGTINVSYGSAENGAIGFLDASEDARPNTIDNATTGVINVITSAGNAYGYNSGADAVNLNNAGQIFVFARDGTAYGVWDYGGYGSSQIDNEAGGTIAVQASQTGIGLWGYQFGDSVTNAGTIKVTAGEAYGVVGANSLNNTGSIIATDTVAGSGSIGVDVSAPATFYGGSGLFTNSGTIQAGTAFFFDTSGYSPPYSGNITIKNSGRIIGAINFSANTGSSTLYNSGYFNLSGRTSTLSSVINSGLIIGDGVLTVTGAGASLSNQSGGVIAAVGKAGLVITKAVNNSGALNVLGSTLTVEGAVSGTGIVQIYKGGVADFAGAFSEGVTFGAAGVLELAQSQTYAATISGFSTSGTTSLDLEDIGFGKATKATYSGTSTSGTLTVTDGTHTASINFSGNYTASAWKLAGDGHGGTRITAAAGTLSAIQQPLLPFIAAMAGIGGAGGGPGSGTQATWQPPGPALANPGSHAG